jgi:hypothetical protein
MDLLQSQLSLLLMMSQSSVLPQVRKFTPIRLKEPTVRNHCGSRRHLFYFSGNFFLSTISHSSAFWHLQLIVISLSDHYSSGIVIWISVVISVLIGHPRNFHFFFFLKYLFYSESFRSMHKPSLSTRFPCSFSIFNTIWVASFDFEPLKHPGVQAFVI